MGIISYIAVTALGAIVVGTGGLGSSILLPVVGFTSTGPAAASLAASAQSFVGNVAAGSIFSGVQAMAMSPLTP